MFRSVSIPSARSRLPGPLAAGLLLLLALAGAPPAHAMSGAINTAYTGDYPITVGSNETLTVANGGSLNTGALSVPAIEVQAGGTLTVTGGSVIGSVGVRVAGGAVAISGGAIGGDNFMEIASGAVTISGGSFSSQHEGVYVDGGTLTISGGSFSSGAEGNSTVLANGGTVNIFGCGLQLDPFGELTGTLQDGTPIDVPTGGLTDSDLISTCPTAYGVNALFAQSGSGKAYKLGSTIPIKLQLIGANGSNASSSALGVQALGLIQIAGGSAAAAVLDPGSSNPDSDFRYDATLQGYILNLSTRNLGAGAWQLTFSVNGQTDPSYTVTFVLR
jgi:hypothetical protein